LPQGHGGHRQSTVKEERGFTLRSSFVSSFRSESFRSAEGYQSEGDFTEN
jgi:hypothetical protein